MAWESRYRGMDGRRVSAIVRWRIRYCCPGRQASALERVDLKIGENKKAVKCSRTEAIGR
jgi:hypothetical protein